MKPFYFLIVSLISISVLIIFLNNQISTYPINANGHTLYCELAITDTQRATGLKHRKSLYQNHGMLFVYKDSQPRTFIMQDCKFPIAIIFCDSAGKVVFMEEMRVNKPKEDIHYRCKKNAMYAIEANKKWFSNNNVKVGDYIKGLPFKVKNQ
ncbi:MAG: hypothetical protein COA79_16860 [Planctomycetota bacterium]|nr:MAG: hypothetical protein COA79_16860 [Planctomycetota bacterium]